MTFAIPSWGRGIAIRLHFSSRWPGGQGALKRRVWASGAAAALGAAIGGTSAIASVPSPMWLGVERVVVNCRFDGSVQPQALRDSLCNQIVAEAARLTSSPVTRATASDLGPDAAANPETSKQLVLHVDAHLAPGARPASALVVRVRPERLGLRRWRGAETRPVKVKLNWKAGTAVLRGPIAPLAFILSEPERRGERPPFLVRSDEF